MNRDIKFRVWCSFDEVMSSSFDLSKTRVFFGVSVRGGSVGVSTAALDDDQYKFMQFTGLKDRDGKEIYENDILYFHGKKKQARFPHNLVFWHDKKARWSLKVIGSDHPDHQEMSLNVTRLADFQNGGSWTVIGNAFENPELAKP